MTGRTALTTQLSPSTGRASKKLTNSGSLSSPEFWFFWGSLALLILPSLPPLRKIESVSAWVKPYFYANYLELGFIKRGLVGTLFHVTALNKLASPSIIALFGHAAVTTALAFTIWRLAAKSFSSWRIRDRIPVYSFALLSPALFLRIGFDTARMDAWCLLITIATLYFLQNCTNPYRCAIIASGSIGIQMLIHDASILFYSPLIFALTLLKGESLPTWPRLRQFVCTAALPGLTAICLKAFGQYEAGQQALGEFLGGKHTELIGTMPMELTSSLADNHISAMPSFSLENYYGGNIAILAYYLLAVGLCLFFSRPSWWVGITVFSPLAVSVLAVDHVRFMGTSITAAALLAMYLAPTYRIEFNATTRRLAYIISGLFFTLGPLGIVAEDPLPLMRYIQWPAF